MRLSLFLVVLGITISSSSSANQTTNDELVKSCEKKTIVFNKQGDRVGEKLDGFCTGYLQGTYHALINSKGSKCKISEAKEAEYLFSVYQTFIKEKKTESSESASSILLQAFKRAFDCK